MNIPLALAIPIAAALVSAIGILWRQLLVERREHREELTQTREAQEKEISELRTLHAAELESERKRSDESESVWRRQWKVQLRQRARDTELYLRSLGRRPLTSSVPPAPIPRKT